MNWFVCVSNSALFDVPCRSISLQIARSANFRGQISCTTIEDEAHEAMPLGTSFCRRYLGRLPNVLGLASSRSLDRGLRKVKPPSREQYRNLLTAVTSSPTLLRKSADIKPELAVLVDTALAWASKIHTSNDPPSHA